MTPQEKIKSALAKSQLTKSEQTDIAEVLAHLPEEEAEHVGELFEKKPEWIYKMADNLILKRFAVERNDPELMDKIIEEEADDLEALAGDGE